MPFHELSDLELMVFKSEISHKEKSLGIAYLMLLGGHLGFHRFYLKKKKTGLIQLFLSILGFVSYIGYAIADGFENFDKTAESYTTSPDMIIFGLIALILFLTVFIWMTIDLFQMPKMVRQINNETEQQLVEQIKKMRTV